MDPKYFDEAAKFLGKNIIDNGEHTRQALIVTDATFLDRYTLGSINRNINPQWVSEIKASMRQLYERKERTMCTACIDVRHVKGAIEDPEAARDFKAVLLDGQHRFSALFELCKEDDKYKTYEFWVVLYLVQNDEEMEQLLRDMDKRIVFTDDDVVTIDVRMRFIKAFKELTAGQETRRCVTGTLNHPVLRDPKITEILRKLPKEAIKSMIAKTAYEYKDKFEQSRLKKSALLDVIEKTKLYQMIEWQSGMWIREMLGTGGAKPPQNPLPGNSFPQTPLSGGASEHAPILGGAKASGSSSVPIPEPSVPYAGESLI
jgi:hypothetical protein